MMDKIYNLQETIYNDKTAIKNAEQKLIFLKGILSAHEKALERALSPKEYAPFSEEKPPQSITEKQETPEESNIVKKERITLENWKNLGIKVGDQVEIVVTNDVSFDNGWVGVVRVVEHLDYEGECFLKLTNHLYRGGWDWYEADKYGRDEIYLIRTKDGSGNYK